MTPISLNSLVNFLTTGKKGWQGEPFILSFDDSLRSQKDNAFPLLVQYKIPAVFAVILWQGDGVHSYMSHSDFKEISDAGMEVICHTFNHPFLPTLRLKNPGAWLSEVVESRQVLSEIISKTVEFFCYPYGAYDNETLELVFQHYKAALITKPGETHFSNQLFELRRVSKT